MSDERRTDTQRRSDDETNTRTGLLAALDEAHAANDRLTERVRLLGRLLTASLVVIVVGTLTLIGMAVLVFQVNETADHSKHNTSLLVESERRSDCRDRVFASAGRLVSVLEVAESTHDQAAIDATIPQLAAANDQLMKLDQLCR